MFVALIFSVLATCVLGVQDAAPKEHVADIYELVDSFLKSPKFLQKRLKSVLESGSISGNFDTNQTLAILDQLTAAFPGHLTKTSIGKSFEKRDIWAYELRKNSGPATKTKILLAGIYHARELTCANVEIGILLTLLHRLLNESAETRFLDTSDVILVPIVNIDSHAHISNSYAGIEPDFDLFKRKNMNSKYCM